MKQIITGITLLLLFASCNNEKKAIVSVAFIDSLINNYSDSAVKNVLESDLQFWKGRIKPKSPGLVNELQHASCLVKRFQVSGDIYDLKEADRILNIADQAFDHKEASLNSALLRNSLLQHRFKMADSLLKQVRNTGIKKYESATMGFDVAFELGYYSVAEYELKQMANPADYGYNFRKAKLAHYKGEMDTAIAAMHRASVLAEGNLSLKQAAVSNEADLYVHLGNLQKANDLYVQSIRLNAVDLHSILALGWIALVHDNNDSLVEKLFQLVRSKTKAPDVIFKLAQLAGVKGDTVRQLKYAREFVSKASTPVYGNMYNKYLLELYTGILNDPARAEALACWELLNRTTPQTYAWYVWALHNNNKTAEAEKIYQQKVSGKPLEGHELYWIGKYMQAQNKLYNAGQFFKAAYKNRYDLSPDMIKDLIIVLEN